MVIFNLKYFPFKIALAVMLGCMNMPILAQKKIRYQLWS